MVVQVIVAELPVMLLAVRPEMVGAVVSRTIVSDIAAVDQLPTELMNWTNTVLSRPLESRPSSWQKVQPWKRRPCPYWKTAFA